MRVVEVVDDVFAVDFDDAAAFFDFGFDEAGLPFAVAFVLGDAGFVVLPDDVLHLLL